VTGDNRRAAIEAEWKRAEEALAEAQLLLDAERPVGATSRAYYAAFHAARALLFSVAVQPRTHQGVRAMVNQHFVRAGQLESRLAQILSQAERAREDADYDATAVFTRADAQEWLGKAREFMDATRALLARGGWLPGTP
jgi:hypothetical protein